MYESQVIDIGSADFTISWLTMSPHLAQLDIQNHLDCLVFEDFLSFNSTVTRCHHFCINYIQSRVDTFRHSFFVNAPFLWNTLPLDVVQSTPYYSFKCKLEQIL